MTQKRSRENLCFSTFFEGQDNKFVAAVYASKDRPRILKAEHTRHLCLREQHFAKLPGSQVGIDPTGNNKTTLPSFAQQIVALPGEELIEIDIAVVFSAIDD